MAETVPVDPAKVRYVLALLGREVYTPCETPGCNGRGGIEAMVSDEGVVGFIVSCPCGASSSDFQPVFELPGQPDEIDADQVRAAGIPVPDPFPDPAPDLAGVIEVREPVRWLVTSRAGVTAAPELDGPAGDWQPFAVTPPGGTVGSRVWFRKPVFGEQIP